MEIAAIEQANRKEQEDFNEQMMELNRVRGFSETNTTQDLNPYLHKMAWGVCRSVGRWLLLICLPPSVPVSPWPINR
jgi:hypothetical protein